jgi:hypothetical protein
MFYRSQMTAYAHAQVAAALQTLNAHRTDATGCCVSCGRPAPCPDQAGAEQSYGRYESWLAPQPVFGSEHRFTERGELVRPYVMNGARR